MSVCINKKHTRNTHVITTHEVYTGTIFVLDTHSEQLCINQ